jgi:hypothetical protein
VAQTEADAADARWGNATVEQKLDMLRRDLKLIRDAHNDLARELRDMVRPMAEALQKIAAEAGLELSRSTVDWDTS